MSELEELREKVARVEALAKPGRTPDGEPLPEWVSLDDLRAALADPAPVVQHDDEATPTTETKD